MPYTPRGRSTRTDTMYSGLPDPYRPTRREWSNYSYSYSHSSSYSPSPPPSPSRAPSQCPSDPAYIRMENVTSNRRRSSSSETNGSSQQKQQLPQEDFQPGKRLSGIREHKVAILLWLLFAAATSLSWLFLYVIPLSTDPVEYGFKTTTNGTCDELESLKTAKGMVLFLINAGTTIVTAIVAYFRAGLLAPSPQAYQKSGGDFYLGVESGRGFLRASWSRKVMYVVLLGASLPLYFLTNSLVFTKYPAYNTYEVLVSTTFFDGKPFDLAGVNMTRFTSLTETPTMPSVDLEWPEEYGASDQLNSSLVRLQQEPTLWKNLSLASCLGQYNEALYARYRTLVMVTDCDADSIINDNSNSALAASVLPGYRLKSASSSLVALCPDKYLEAYNGTIHPSKTPFLQAKPEGIDTSMELLSPAEAHEWATNGSLSSADISESSSLERRRATSLTWMGQQKFNPMPSQDLCYHYWADDDRWMSKHPRIYRVPQCPLRYCLAEPVETPLMCQAVYSPRVLFILSVFLSCLLAVITVALVLRCARDSLYSAEDVSEYFQYVDLKSRPGWREPFYDEFCRGESIFRHRRLPWHLAFLSLVVFVYVWVLWGNAGSSKEDIKYPSGPQDDSWLFKALALNQVLHIIFEVQVFFQDADVNKRVFRVEFDNESHHSRKASRLEKLKKKMRGFARTTLLSTRSSLIHYTFTLIFITQLMGVAPLEQAAGSLTDAMPVAFTTFGVPAFNSRWVNVTFGFFLFNWVVFVFLPSFLLDLTFYATTGIPADKRERVLSASSLLFLGATRPLWKCYVFVRDW